MTTPPMLVFVHGALVRDAPWWWSRMREPLAAHGFESQSVPLPSCGETEGARGGLAEDIGAVRRAVDEVDGPVVLLGHSYGGMVITGAGVADQVRRLVYVSSVMPDADESQGQIAGDHPAPWVLPGEEGMVRADPELIRALFLQDCAEGVTEAALQRLTPQPAAVFGEVPGVAAWRQTPATFVVCTEDLAFPAEVQRRRVRPGTRSVDVAAGHHPFLSQPEAFARLLAGEIALG